MTLLREPNQATNRELDFVNQVTQDPINLLPKLKNTLLDWRFLHRISYDQTLRMHYTQTNL